jgi:hypothetical protein
LIIEAIRRVLSPLAITNERAMMSYAIFHILSVGIFST